MPFYLKCSIHGKSHGVNPSSFKTNLYLSSSNHGFLKYSGRAAPHCHQVAKACVCLPKSPISPLSLKLSFLCILSNPHKFHPCLPTHTPPPPPKHYWIPKTNCIIRKQFIEHLPPDLQYQLNTETASTWSRFYPFIFKHQGQTPFTNPPLSSVMLSVATHTDSVRMLLYESQIDPSLVRPYPFVPESIWVSATLCINSFGFLSSKR